MCTASETVGPKVSVVVPVNSPDVMTSTLNRNVGVTNEAIVDAHPDAGAGP